MLYAHDGENHDDDDDDDDDDENTFFNVQLNSATNQGLFNLVSSLFQATSWLSCQNSNPGLMSTIGDRFPLINQCFVGMSTF